MKHTVLIVEDEQMLRDVYKMVLESKNYIVHTAPNGLEGLAVASKVKPNVILLDMFMPVMDGKEFLRNFDNSMMPDTKIIVYTNLSDQSTKSEMMSLGADDFVLKSSMTPNDLINLVTKILQ